MRTPGVDGGCHAAAGDSCQRRERQDLQPAGADADRAGSSVDILQDFTADRNHLLSILQTMVVGEGQEGAEVANDDSSSDTGAAFGQDDGEINIFTTDRQLAALQTAAESLGRLN